VDCGKKSVYEFVLEIGIVEFDGFGFLFRLAFEDLR